MINIMKKYFQFVFAVFFIGIILITSIFSIRNSYQNLKSTTKSILAGQTSIKAGIKNIESEFDNNITRKRNWIDIHGLTQRIMQKNEVGNFDVLKDKAGMLHRPYKHNSSETLSAKAENLFNIYQYAVKKNINFLYTQAPSDIIDGKTIFSIGLSDQYSNDLDVFIGYISEKNIPFLDIRQYIQDMDISSIFYKTDHHWNLPLSFKTMTLSIEKINQLYDMNIDINGEIRNLTNYEKIIYPDSFLGSIGIRTGRYYTGKDNFLIYIPNFSTSLEYFHYINGNLALKTNGDFYTAFINESLLRDASYNNKYSVFLYDGYAENQIINHLADNTLKCLLISDSFSRSMAPYLSLCFKETRYLDPQDGRYTNSYIDYIDEYQPDIIIILFNGRSVYIDIPQ